MSESAGRARPGRPRPAGAGPLVVLAVAALVPALVLFGLWRWAAGRATGADPPPGTTPPAGEPAPVLSTPLLSFRRSPAVLSRDVNRSAFEDEVERVAGTIGDRSCLSVSLGGRPVGGRNEELPVIPASNQKLVIAAAALEVLGSGHRFTTEVRAETPVDGGVGDLYLVGGGDPVLVSDAYPNESDRFPVVNATSLDDLADAVVAAGITRVDGAVLGDASRYDDEWYAPSWSEDVRVVEGGPYDALMVNDSRVTGDPQRADVPAEGAARELTRLLTERGVEVAGTPAAGTAPDGLATVAEVSSRRLGAIIAEMLTTSDNNTAEMLVKEIGVASGAAGTRTAGLAAVLAALDEAGVPTAGAELADGSGLSNDNRVTCALLDGVLAGAGPGTALGDALPTAGASGTLADVFVGTTVAGRMRAKTGTLGNAPFDADPPAVKSLSGFVPVTGGDVIRFALVLNDGGPLTDQSVYRPIWDDLAGVLGDYPAGPGPDVLGVR